MDPQFQNDCIVTGILGLLLRMSQIFGVASIKVKNVRNQWHIRVSQAASLYDKVVILIMCLLTAIGMTWDTVLNVRMSSFHYSPPVHTILFIAMASMISAALLVQAFTGLYRMQTVISSLAQIRKINAELRLYSPIKSWEKTTQILTVASLIGGFFVLIFDYGIFIYRNNIGNGNVYIQALCISHYIKYAMLKILTMQISLVFTYVLLSFYHLNVCLNHLLQQMIDKCTHNITKAQYPDPVTVQRLGFHYRSLCNIVQKLDGSHGVVLVPIVGSFLLHLVVTPYSFITKIFGDTVDVCFATSQIFWALYHGSDLIRIVEPCHRTQRQMDRTKQLISKLLRATPPDNHQFIAELELFYKHVMVNEAVYAPVNLFHLNRAFLLTILGSVTTYLVVVIKL